MANSQRYAIGVDIGGTGMKAGLVNLRKGKLVGERMKLRTPAGATIADVRATAIELVSQVRTQPKALEKVADPFALPIGLCMPSIIRDGIACSAANIAAEWIGFAARDMFAEALGRDVALVNDADAAGLAEVRFGRAAGATGTVLVITLGTGIGSALIYQGRLFPNTELGHLELDGHPDYEKFASARVRELEALDDETWCARLTPYFRKLEALFAPSLFIISGGISKRAEEFLHLVDIETPIASADLRNNAGIIGAAILGAEGWR